MIETLKPEVFSAVGFDTARTDGAEKVTGQTHFTADLKLPRMLYARLVVSPYAHARIKNIDSAEALKIPGVVRVVTAQDLPIVGDGGESRRRNPLANGEVIFYGQPVAVVLGESEAAALDGVNNVTVDYEALPVVASITDALKPDAPRVRIKESHGVDSEAQMHATVEANADDNQTKLHYNISNHNNFKRGDIEKGFAEATVIIENTYTLPMVHQGYIENQVAAAEPTMTGGFTIYSSTQGAFYTKQEVAAGLGIPQSKVKVVAMPVGGGFGGKVAFAELFTAALAKLVRRPVMLAYYRMEDLSGANPSFNALIEVKLGARADGSFSALKTNVYFETGAYPGTALGIAGLVFAGYYKVDNYEINCFEVMTHKPGVGAYRAPGAPQATFAYESAVDGIVQALGRDPLELRYQNASQEGDPGLGGRPSPRIGLKEVIATLQNHPLWQNRHNKQPGEGIGVAIGGWPGGLEPASSTCRLDHDGNLTITTGISDISGVTTSLGLIAAEVLGLKPNQITVENTDTSSAPYAGTSGGSKTLYTVGAAVLKAAQDAKQQILNIAGTILEANPEDLEIKDGKISVKGVSSKAITLTEIANRSMNFGGRFEPVYGRGSSAITHNAPGFAAHLAKIKVDSETGEVEVLDYVAVQDVGKAINPAEVRGQVHGGVVQGLGWALYEQLVYDENGTLISGSLMDYALQTAVQVPSIDVHLVEIPAPDGPFGAKGVGEPPIIPGGATIANAIYDAVGVRANELPAVPERLLTAIQSAANDTVTKK